MIDNLCLRQNNQKHEEYRQSLRDFNEEKKSAVRKYENKLLENKKENPKSYFKYMSKKNKYSSKVILTDESGTPELDDEKGSDVLNDFFIYVEKNTAIPKLTGQRFEQDMPELIINEETVLENLMKLNINKSSGPDKIPAILLKQTAEAFKTPLSLLFSRSYNEGKVPSILKNANVTPLFKGGKSKTPNNFRPISLTSVIAKVMERIFKKTLVKFIEENDIISNKQHGFRPGRSTSSNLITTWEKITDWADENKGVSIIYTDFRKAFDNVPKELLLMKLEHYGVRGKNLQWLNDFLTDRSQQVVLNGKTSRTKEIKTACPQGGVLSGILFSLYINDLPDVIKKCEITLYADDAKIFLPITGEDSIKEVQEDIDNLVNWSTDWRQDLSVKKCHHIDYLPKKYANLTPEYKISGMTIERKSKTTDLGITISEDLKFHAQVDKVKRLATLEINRLRRSFTSRNPKFVRNAYKTYIRPNMEYCVELWNPQYKGDIIKLEKVQNKITKLMNYGNTMSPAERNKRMKLKCNYHT